MQKSILITGASTGIGYYVAHQLKQDGYLVIASCRQASDVLRLQAEGLNAVQIDLADSVSIESGFHAAMQLTNGNLYALLIMVPMANRAQLRIYHVPHYANNLKPMYLVGRNQPIWRCLSCLSKVSEESYKTLLC